MISVSHTFTNVQLLLSLCPDVISYHSQQSPLLLEGGAAAQHACYHDDGSSQDQYVGGGSIGLGGEKADVVALLNQGPNTHRHHNAPCQLGEEHMIKSPTQNRHKDHDSGPWNSSLYNTEETKTWEWQKALNYLSPKWVSKWWRRSLELMVECELIKTTHCCHTR